MESRGATVWARQTIDSDIFYWKPAEWFKIWFYIVNRVNHTGNKLFSRGENLMTYKEIEEATKTSRNQVDSFIRWAKKEQMLTTRKTTRGFVIKVLKYAKYQDWNTYKTEDKPTQKPKQNRNTTDTITKNDKHVKNEEEYSPAVKYISENLKMKITPNVIKLIDVTYKDYKIKRSIDKMAAEYQDVRKKVPTTLGLMNWLENGIKFGEIERKGRE